MKDKFFIPNFIDHSPPAFAQRLAVLYPILNKRSINDQDILNDVWGLLYRWKGLVRLLSDLNYDLVSSSGKYWQCQNCLPQIVVMKNGKGSRPCQLRELCPWCHCRDVSKLHKMLATYFKQSAEQHQILEITNTKSLHRNDLDLELVTPILRSVAIIPKKLIKKLKPIGAYQRTFIDPYMENKTHKLGWNFIYKVLAIVPPTFTIPDWLNTGRSKLRLSHEITRKSLIGIVGRVLRYPKGNFNCEGTTVLAGLNAQLGLRLREHTGVLRQKLI